MSSRTIRAVKPTKRGKGRKAPGIIRLPHNWLPRPHQEKFWDYLENGGKRGIALWHRRGGKDDVCLNWTGVASFDGEPGNFWYLLPEANQGRKAIWNAVDEETGIRRIDQAFPEGLRAQTSDQDMFIRFRNGSTFQIGGSDNYNSLVGSSPRGVVFSEWPLANEAAWVYLSPILEKNGGWALFPYTPRGKNHGFRFWNRSQTDARWFGQRLTVEQTDVFTPAMLAAAKADLIALYGEDDGENLFQQEYYCSFDVAIIGAYFGKLIARLEQDGGICRVPYDPSHPVYTGWDLGLDDATAIWFFQVIGREVRIIDFMQVRNRALVEISKDVIAKPYAYAEHFWPHDGDTREQTYAKTRKETCEGVGLRPIRIGTPRDDEERINAIRQFLPKCVFSNAPHITPGIEALRSFRVDYDDKNKTPRLKPKHDWASHPTHAFAEFVMQFPGAGYQHRRQTMAQSNYDPLRLGDPQYSRQLEGEAMRLEDQMEDRPWLRQQTGGDYDPFNVK